MPPPYRAMKKTFLCAILLFLGSAASSFSQSEPSYFALEVNSSRILFSHNAEEKRPVSSLSQVATAIVALDWAERTKADLNTVIPVPQEAYALGSVGNPTQLTPGDRITLRDALYSTLLGADNVSALTIASYVGKDLVYRRGGGAPVDTFVKEMNNLASGLGMRKTSFRAPHGLDIPGQESESCAVDMALLGSYSMQNAAFSFIVRQVSRRIGVESAARGVQYFNVVNTNKMLSQPGVDGIKTGSSRLAGPCLLLSATRQSYTVKNPGAPETIYPQRLIIVVLGTEERFALGKTLMVDGWRAWEEWQKTGMSNHDKKDFLSLPNPGAPAKNTQQ